MSALWVWSLLVGSLGLQTTLWGSWMRQQETLKQRHEEEEETLTRYESKAEEMVSPELEAHLDHLDHLASPAAASSSPAVSNGSSKPAPRDPRLVGWEFKIVRANRDLFRDSAIFQKLCEEEAEAGWIMLEKLDDRRVRFKRPIAMRNVIAPEFLNYDPYRCFYGSSFNWGLVLGTIAALFAITLPAYLGYALVMATIKSPSASVTPVSTPIAQPSLPTNNHQ